MPIPPPPPTPKRIRLILNPPAASTSIVSFDSQNNSRGNEVDLLPNPITPEVYELSTFTTERSAVPVRLSASGSCTISNEFPLHNLDAPLDSFFTPPPTLNPSTTSGILTAVADDASSRPNNDPFIAGTIPRPRQRRPAQPSFETPPGSPSFEAIYAIISKYFKSNAVSRTIANRLDALALNESITMNNITRLATKTTRPSKEEITQMVLELDQLRILNITHSKNRSILISKSQSTIENEVEY